jgi:hypothetical protein
LRTTPPNAHRSGSRRSSAKRPDSESEAGEKDESRGNREPLRSDPSIPPTDRKARPPAYAGVTLRRQFREVVKTLTHKAPAPQPTPRRRRTEETRGGFRLFARKIMRRIMQKPTPPPETSPVWDAMTQQHFWGDYFLTDDNDTGPGDFYQDCARPEAFQECSGFSPHL